MNFFISHETSNIDFEQPKNQQLHTLCNVLNTKAQKFKRQEILNSKRKDFTPSLTKFANQDATSLIFEFQEIVTRNFNRSTISNTHKNKHLKNILCNLRSILQDHSEIIANTKNFDIFLDCLLKLLKSSPTDLLFESLRNISLLTFHSDLFDSTCLISPLLELIELQEKKLNIVNANIVLEKILFSVGNLVLESNSHHEFFINSKLPELLIKMLYRNDINLLTTGLWVLSNIFRKAKEDSLQEIIVTGKLYKVLIHLFNKFNENNNSLLISELLWLLGIISNNASKYELFNATLILKVACYLTSNNIKLSIPALTILANLSQFLGENCFELVKNQTFQKLIDLILSSNIYIWKRELIFLLSNFVAVDPRIAEFFILNQNLMDFLGNMFLDFSKFNYKDDIFLDLCYFFFNIVSHHNQNFAKILASNYAKVRETFNMVINSSNFDFNVKNLAKNFLDATI